MGEVIAGLFRDEEKIHQPQTQTLAGISDLVDK